MDSTYSEIQGTEKTSYTDITESDIELETVGALFPDFADLYDGPGAMTLTEIAEKARVSFRIAKRGIDKRLNTDPPELVKVKVRREDSLGRLRAPDDAYVLKRIHDWWQANRSRDEL